MPEEGDGIQEDSPSNKRKGKQRPSGQGSISGGGKPRPGGGAHSPNINTSGGGSTLVRPDGPTYEFGGATYFGNSQHPLRRDRILAVADARTFSLEGRIYLNAQTNAQKALVYPFCPALRGVDQIWDNCYARLRDRAMDERDYRHLPESLNRLSYPFDFIQAYMSTRMMLGELTSWMKMSQFDTAHVLTNQHARKISRGRVEGMWESVGSVPMFPGIVELADFWSKPVVGDHDSIVYHPTWPYSVDHQLWGLTVGTAAGNLTYTTEASDEVTTVDADAKFTNMANTIDLLIGVLIGQTGTDNDKADFVHLSNLLRLGIGLPSHPMSFNEWSPVIQDKSLIDQYLYRGMHVGVDDVTGATEDLQYYPWANHFANHVEQRGMGSPNGMAVAGLLQPQVVLKDYVAADVDEDELVALLGAHHYGHITSGTTPTSFNDKTGSVRVLEVYSDEDGWGEIISSLDARADSHGDIIRRHQYSEVQNLAANTGLTMDMGVNDVVDYSFYEPIAEVGRHYLAWLSQTLGLPHMR